jgi:hypothetical protein
VEPIERLHSHGDEAHAGAVVDVGQHAKALNE